MSDGYRNGAFALGIVVGGGITLNLFLWLDYRAHHANEAKTGTGYNQHYSEIGRYWDWLLGTFVSPSDTLAQWIMAIFTIAATIVLLFTLRSANNTNKAAIAANRILEQSITLENPPKITAWQVDVDQIVADTPLCLSIRLINEGNSPALLEGSNLWFKAFPYVTASGLPRKHPHDAEAVFPVGKTTIEPGEFCEVRVRSDTTLTQAQCDDIIGGNGNFKLYVIGLGIYRNARLKDNTRLQRFLFCRLYNPVSDRFERTDDPGYDYQS